MGLLAVRFDERLVASASLSGDPPPFEAYQAFDEGMDIYIRGGSSRDAQMHFRHAFELDPTWADALLFLVTMHVNLGEYGEADSLLETVGEISATLTPYHRAYLDYVQALVAGDNERALVAIRRAAETAPGSRAWYNYGMQSMWTNRPQQAVTALSTLDPERGAMREWMMYWYQLTSAYQMLGEHEQALAAARRAQRLYPERRTYALYLQTRALAALGRIEELDELLDELANASDPNVVRQAMVYSALILRTNGHTDAAENVLRRATEWFESRPSSETVTEGHRWWYVWTLFLAGRVEEAVDLCSVLVEDYPEDAGYRGNRGYFAAVAGDTTQALRDAEWLANNDDPYLQGSHTFQLACLAAALGDHERALELLRQSYAEGTIYQFGMHFFPPLDPLRDHPEFQEFIRPKG
jgi:tetratricopeptide (TPR) repeat protein